LIFLSSFGGAFFAPVGVVSSSTRSSGAAAAAAATSSHAGSTRHTTGRGSATGHSTQPNIFADAASGRTQQSLDPHTVQQMVATGPGEPEGSEISGTPAGEGGVDVVGDTRIGSAGPVPPPPPAAMSVDGKGTASTPPSIWNLPNIITMARVVAIPVFATVFYADFPRRNVWCSSIFAGAAVTDWLDGYIARKQGIVTPFGAFLDPVADKLMVSTALILLSQRLGPWMTVCSAIILCRELTISALREWMAQLGSRDTVKVGNAGKWKAATQVRV
ncbi:unnamed protein product, partial [Sphacelaria rigidula]